MASDELSEPTLAPSGRRANRSRNASRSDATPSRLSLFVFTDTENVPRDGGCFNPVSDIAWLQFIEGLDMYVVDDERDDVDVVDSDHDVPDSGLWLVDETGSVHSRWSLPSERKEVLMIGRTVEKTIDRWGEAQ